LAVVTILIEPLGSKLKRRKENEKNLALHYDCTDDTAKLIAEFVRLLNEKSVLYLNKL